METYFQIPLKNMLIFPYQYFFFISSKFSTNNYENILRKRNARNMTMDNNNNKGNNYKKGDISNNIKSKSI